MRAVTAIACAVAFCATPAAAQQSDNEPAIEATGGPVILADENGARPVTIVPLANDYSERSALTPADGTLLTFASFEPRSVFRGRDEKAGAGAAHEKNRIGGAELLVSR